MTVSIRGHQSLLKILLAGQQTEVANITSFDVKQDSSFTRAMYVGAQTPEGDQSMEGWSGTFEAEVKDSKIDDLIDAIVENNLNGVGIEDVTIVDTELYGDGTTRSYVYFDVQMKMGKKTSGLNTKMTKSLEFQASGRLKL